MRFHTTKQFADLQAALKAADQAFEAEFDKDEESAATTAALDETHRALAFLAVSSATTPTEVRRKLEVFEEREAHKLKDPFRAELFAGLRVDLARLQGHPVGPALGPAFMRWRGLYEQAYYTARSDEDADRLCNERHAEFVALMAVPCTTPGDFFTKTYVNLLEHYGSTLVGPAREDLTGNGYDICLDEVQDPVEENAVWVRTAYSDLDATDIGANLLAYGMPCFSAEKWMERADAVDLGVTVTIDAAGKRWLGISMNHPDEPPAFVRRERDRLQRLSAFYDGENRVAAIVKEIEREWPQLILRKSPDEGEKSHGSLPGKAA